ncbi:DNA adenine methylase [Xanthomonas sp. D-99]|uniref:DNA adenine methylase n=1 Tax=Xanthomonas sp. D-99 TaxID=2821273 RepID=UPI001ADCA8A0|nr:DNA adenine methylase [Xanthomonas sp. D-99]MBO9879661.1 DNA adenine methylase [Xanthomonas sp. D-99]
MNEAISRSFSAYEEERGSLAVEEVELATALRDGFPQKPFLRWAGGKTRLLSAILPHAPNRFNNFHEPFLGSGAMFFAVRARARRCYLSDLNSELINLWQVVQTKPRAFFNRLQPYLDRQGEDEYYVIRAEEPTRSLERAARFFYLNQTSWNGLWRENRWGVFNVPWGARAFRGIEFASLKAVADTLKDTEIVEQDFRQAIARAQPGDFVYMDPPYLPISDTSKFAGYNGKRFRIADLEELAFLCEGLTKRGVHWIVSNRDNEHIREIFSHAQVYSFTTRRSVSAQAKRHIQPKDSPEVIVVGGPNR